MATGDDDPSVSTNSKALSAELGIVCMWLGMAEEESMHASVELGTSATVAMTEGVLKTGLAPWGVDRRNDLGVDALVVGVALALALALATGLVSADSFGVALALGVDKAAKTSGVLGAATVARGVGVGVAAVGVLGACGVAVTPMRTMANLRVDDGAADNIDDDATVPLAEGVAGAGLTDIAGAAEASAEGTEGSLVSIIDGIGGSTVCMTGSDTIIAGETTDVETDTLECCCNVRKENLDLVVGTTGATGAIAAVRRAE
jgi:hypothetical protein